MFDSFPLRYLRGTESHIVTYNLPGYPLDSTTLYRMLHDDIAYILFILCLHVSHLLISLGNLRAPLTPHSSLITLHPSLLTLHPSPITSL